MAFIMPYSHVNSEKRTVVSIAPPCECCNIHPLIIRRSVYCFFILVVRLGLHTETSPGSVRQFFWCRIVTQLPESEAIKRSFSLHIAKQVPMYRGPGKGVPNSSYSWYNSCVHYALPVDAC